MKGRLRVTSPAYREPYPAVPESRLTELEEQLGARLPEPYRVYLAAQDGGALEGYNNHGIEIILGIGEVPKWSSLWYLLGQERDVIPGGWIPVGTDAGGGLFLLVVTAQDRGSVWYQSSELEEDDDGVSHPVVRERLADSWDEFLASIEPVEA
ncbi:SMI1/KNR4 family protein [Kribbella speibonae]|uniref:SMI1/KNR4 family protein n=1 Tax=Kribbella speibonae TaxID=1572660 RepID=A0A4R0J1K2_9ACTN|nr:SMI1/KNR4 family protein [Kribbella speibonae]TCC40271.1 SMI1/KNR4 family protein [Kribbella speibonae]